MKENLLYIFTTPCYKTQWWECVAYVRLGVLCSVANRWGLHKELVLLTTVNRPNYRLKP